MMNCSKPGCVNEAIFDWCVDHLPLSNIAHDERVIVGALRAILDEVRGLRQDLTERHVEKTYEEIRFQARLNALK